MARQSQKEPNVVVVFTDQQRWDTTGVHGNPMGLTPTFDRVAKQGTHLFNSFTAQPVCGPARSCLQTGLYATQTGVFRNGLALDPELHTLAHYFGEAGYHTGYIGKWHLADEEPVPAHQQGGYDFWLGANCLEHTSTPYDTVVYDEEGTPVKLPGYRVDALTHAAIDYINDHQDEPFYLFLSFLEPHHQNTVDAYLPPDGYRERYRGGWLPPDLASLEGSAHQQIAGYYGLVKCIDEAFRRLLDTLKSLRLAEDTIVLFTSDHGCHFKTRNQEYKRSCHESSIRVPTVLRGPEFDGGGQVGELVSIVDLPPTLLDAAGLNVPDEMEGHSILPLLRGEDADWPEEVFIQISESQVGRSVRTKRWKYSVVAPGKDAVEEKDADTYIEECLYDLKVDPYELTNLIGYESHQQVASVMRERLIRRMEEVGERVPTIEVAPTRPGGQRKVADSEVYE